MANTYNLSEAVMEQQLLSVLDPLVPILTAFTTDLSPAISEKGDSVKVNYATSTSASLWAGTYAPGDESLSVVTVTMGEPFYRSYGLSPNEIASYGEAGIVNKTKQGLIDVVTECYKQIYAVATNATNAPIVAFSASNASFGFNAVQSGSKVCVLSGSSQTPVAVLNTTLDFALDGDMKNTYGASATVINGQTNGTPCGKAIRYCGKDVPTNSVGVAGFICTPEALVVASRVPPTVNPSTFRTLVKHKSGFTVAMDIWGDETLGKVIVAYKIQFAVSKGRAGLIARFIDTDNRV